jgi:hypothetical protein
MHDDPLLSAAAFEALESLVQQVVCTMHASTTICYIKLCLMLVDLLTAI